MGLLMEKELKHLRDGLQDPAKPFVVILGGAKVSDKIGVLKALMEKANTILIGGAMANTFLKAEGIPVGTSRVESDKVGLARELLDFARERTCETPVVSRPNTESRMDGRPWISAPEPSHFIRRKLPGVKRFCGMARWAFLKFLNSAKAQSQSPKRWHNRARRQSSAAETL
jgi:hypothetical protein